MGNVLPIQKSSLTDLEAVPHRLADDICLLVQEVLVNAARHAGASLGSLAVTVGDLHRIYEKPQVRSRAELIVFCREKGII